MPLSAGTRLGPYEILASIGAGGMGEVYKVRDTRLGRIVAIKVLPPDRVADPERRRRFVQEAKAASALNHPSIVTVHDIGSDDGTDYMVMEWVNGRTFAALIAAKQLRLAEVLKYAAQAADALAKAHAAGIIHRDLKPGNLMVNADDLVKVLDFGLAKLTDPTEINEDDATRTMAAATEKGTILGTIAYMSPEQAEGKKLDARSDIFSFGAVLYEMIAGRRAFQGDSKAATLGAILHKEPMPSTAPPEIERMVARCLRKDPARRFQSMADLRVALVEAMEESTAGATPTHRRAAWPWIAAVVVVSVLAIATVAMLWRGRKTLEAPARETPLTTLPGEEISPTFSPDASQVAFEWTEREEGSPSIYVKVVGSESMRRLTDNLAWSPAWSPDGRWIAFMILEPDGHLELRLIAPLGGPERLVTELYLTPDQASAHEIDLTKGERLLAWSPDSKWLAVSDAIDRGGRALFLVSIATGERRRLTWPPAKSDDREPAFSPDGRMLAFVRAGSLLVLRLTKDLQPQGEPRQTPFGKGYARTPNWMPDGRTVLILTEGRFLKVPVSGWGQPERPAYTGGGHPYQGFALSKNGDRLAYSKNTTDLNIYRLELSRPGVPASPAVPFLSSTQADLAPRYSPDGKKIAFTSDRSGADSIWVANADGSGATPLVEGFLATWSPDGRRIVFARNVDDKSGLYVVSSNGGQSNWIAAVDRVDYPVLWFTWSQDGKWIYFPASRGGKMQSWKVPADGGEPVPVPGLENARQLQESPDGRFLFFQRSKALWKTPLAGGFATQILSQPTSDFTLTREGFYFLAAGSQSSRIEYFEFATGGVKTVLKTEKMILGNPAVRSDSRSLLYTQFDSIGADLVLVENFH